MVTPYKVGEKGLRKGRQYCLCHVHVECDRNSSENEFQMQPMLSPPHSWPITAKFCCKRQIVGFAQLQKSDVGNLW